MSKEAKVGTLYVAPNGDAYRLRGYDTDWTAKPFTGEHTKPNCSVGLVEGASTSSRELPDGSVLVWEPVGDVDA